MHLAAVFHVVPSPFHLAEDSQKHLAESGKSNKFGQPPIDLMLKEIHSWYFNTLVAELSPYSL